MTLDFLNTHLLIFKPYPSAPHIIAEAETVRFHPTGVYITFKDTHKYAKFEISESKIIEFPNLFTWISKEQHRDNVKAERQLVSGLFDRFNKEDSNLSIEDFFVREGFEKEYENWKKDDDIFYMTKYKYLDTDKLS